MEDPTPTPNPSQGSKPDSSPNPNVAPDPLDSSPSDRVLKTERIRVDRKVLICTLKENRRGRYVPISEQTGKNRNTIIVSATGIEPLLDALQGFLVQDPVSI